ncbi:hypothetical protein ACFPRH_29700, partial [Streptomyces amakusaensis]
FTPTPSKQPSQANRHGTPSRHGHLRHASAQVITVPDTPRLGKADFDHMVRLGWVRSPQSVEARFGTSRAGAVDIALYRTADVDAIVPAHPDIDWARLRAVEKGRRSPLADLRTGRGRSAGAGRRPSAAAGAAGAGGVC